MKPSEQRERSYWLWQEYLAVGEVSYLAAAVRDAYFYLHPKQVGGSLLLLAIEQRDLPAVRRLLELGADVNAPAPDGYTYLHCALEIDEVERLVPMLLEAGADPSVRGICGRNALHHAAMLGVVAAIPALVAHGANVNARTDVDNLTTPLMEAAMFGHVQAVRSLLELGADPSLLDAADMSGRGGGRSARQIAVEGNHAAVVRELDRWQGQ
jgi:ankyrin repeat protein